MAKASVESALDGESRLDSRRIRRQSNQRGEESRRYSGMRLRMGDASSQKDSKDKEMSTTTEGDSAAIRMLMLDGASRTPGVWLEGPHEDFGWVFFLVWHVRVTGDGASYEKKQATGGASRMWVMKQTHSSAIT